MYKICVFGGTPEGRELVEFLNAQPCEVTACVATEYGQALLPEAERLTVSARRLPADEIKALLTDRHFALVIDATHPYAASITKSIARACAETGVERWRLLRGASDAPEDAVFVESTEKAIEFLDQTEGNILLTTGSKELKAYSQIKDFAERVYARVLPLDASLALCREAGVQPSHILAMQGPFSEEMDTAMLRAVSAKWLVTKDGGDCYEALSHGTIDAAEYSSPSANWAAGFQEVAPYLTVPGVHQSCSVYLFLINRNIWDGLDAQTQSIIKLACTSMMAQNWAEDRAANGKAWEQFRELEAQGKLTIYRMPDEDLDKIQEVAQEYYEEKCAANPLFEKIYRSQQAYIASVSDWSEAATAK